MLRHRVGDEGADGAVFQYGVTPVPTDVVDFLVERDLAALANVLGMIAGPLIGLVVGRIDVAFSEDRRGVAAQVRTLLLRSPGETPGLPRSRRSSCSATARPTAGSRSGAYLDRPSPGKSRRPGLAGPGA